MRILFANRIAVGILVLAGLSGCVAPPPVATDVDVPPTRQKAGRQQKDHGKVGPAEPTVESVLDRWTKRLEDTGFLHLVLRCSRRTFDATDSSEIGEPIDDGSYIIAESSMAPDSYVLMVWETDSNWKKKQSQPHLILGFADGYAHERVWYEKQQKYRTRVFETESLLGPLDCSYDGAGCQYGALLTTWVGTTTDPYSARETNNRKKPFSKMTASPDPQHPNATVVRTQVPPTRKNGKIVYDRWDDHFYDESGVMLQWTTTVYQGMHRPDDPYYIVQDRSYEYEFRDAPSDRETAMIEDTRSRINGWLRAEKDSG